MNSQGARQLGDRVIVPRDVAMRLDRFAMAIGTKRASVLFGVGEATLDTALDQGTMLPATYDRLVTALEREEAKAKSV